MLLRFSMQRFQRCKPTCRRLAEATSRRHIVEVLRDRSLTDPATTFPVQLPSANTSGPHVLDVFSPVLYAATLSHPLTPKNVTHTTPDIPAHVALILAYRIDGGTATAGTVQSTHPLELATSVKCRQTSTSKRREASNANATSTQRTDRSGSTRDDGGNDERKHSTTNQR